MTEKQMTQFLKAEGWGIHVHSGFWWDPVKNFSNPLNIETAYRIASRRKAQRDTRRLKAAGYEYGMCIAHGWGWFYSDLSEKAGSYIGTRAKALATLETARP